jgi:hypothetical protein
MQRALTCASKSRRSSELGEGEEGTEQQIEPLRKRLEEAKPRKKSWNRPSAN